MPSNDYLTFPSIEGHYGFGMHDSGSEIPRKCKCTGLQGLENGLLNRLPSGVAKRAWYVHDLPSRVPAVNAVELEI